MIKFISKAWPNKNLVKNNIYLILIVVLSLPAVWALFHKGFYGASDDIHIAWLFEMDKIIRLGQIPPRFVPDLSFGFGYPLFNFVFPLPFYLGEIFHLFSFSFVDAIKIVFGLSLLGSAVTMYFFLKEVLSRELAAAGAILYLYTPYRSTDVYIRGAFGEALSFVFLPLVLLAAVKIYKGFSDKKIDPGKISFFSLSLSALILTHNIVSYMFFPFLLMLLLLLILTTRNKKMWLSINYGLGILGALLISLYFWLPAITESSLMKYETVFNFVDHFPTLKQLFTPYFGYGASVPGPYDGMSFFIGLMNLAVVAAGTILGIFLWRKFKALEGVIFIWGIMAFSVSMFMMNFRSSFLWSNVPLLPYFQFPWRFLTMITLSSVIFLIPLNYLKGFWKYILVGGLSLLAIILNAEYFKPHDFLERGDEYYINRYIPVPQASKEYLETGEEYLRLPNETEVRPDKNYPVIFSDNKFGHSVKETNGVYSKINIEAPDDMILNHNKYYFPGWVGKVDGNDLKLSAGKPFGQISFEVTKGSHLVEIYYKEPNSKIILNLISLSSFTLFLILALKYNNRK